MELDVLVEDARWDALNLEKLAHAAVSATLDHLDFDRLICEASVLACDDARIAVLNGDFRDKSTATNVLSWPAEDRAAKEPGDVPERLTKGIEGTIALGDIALAFETCAREALEMQIPFQDHITHLLVHGTLHLLGYDHIRDPDATLMQGIETEILGKMGLNDPYSL